MCIKPPYDGIPLLKKSCLRAYLATDMKTTT